MLLKGKDLLGRMNRGVENNPRSISVTPTPNDINNLERTGEAAIDLRLGRWFRTLRQSRVTALELANPAQAAHNEAAYTKEYFVPFDRTFVLHPHKFVLGITLEWLSMPYCLAGYVTGKSSLGRRGLIIETAAGIHPGFSGCLTLELTNVGEAPLALRPGMKVCQVFFHVTSDDMEKTQSQFNGRCRPTLGALREDSIVEQLRGRS